MTETAWAYGTAASPASTWSTGSNSSGGVNRSPVGSAERTRSRRNVRTSPLSWSHPVTYQRPACSTRPYGSNRRVLSRPRQAV